MPLLEDLMRMSDLFPLGRLCQLAMVLYNLYAFLLYAFYANDAYEASSSAGILLIAKQLPRLTISHLSLAAEHRQGGDSRLLLCGHFLLGSGHPLVRVPVRAI